MLRGIAAGGAPALARRLVAVVGRRADEEAARAAGRFTDFFFAFAIYACLTAFSIRRTSTTRSSGRHGLVTKESQPAFFAPSEAPASA